MHRYTAVALGIAVALGVVQVAWAYPAPPPAEVHSESIAPMPLKQALREFAQREKLQIVYVSDVADGLQTQGAPAGLTQRATLEALLKGTNLQFQYLGTNAVTISRVGDPAGGSASNDGDNVPTSTRPQSEKPLKQLETMVVTGSRIARPDLALPTPQVPISAQELHLDSLPNVGAAVNDLPFARATSSPQTTGSNTGAGWAPIDLRGLGIDRTLVLLDGRRFSYSNDLNTIPSILLTGVDIVTGGASAAWGSGAVSGVVNLHLNQGLDGFKANTHIGASDLGGADEKGFGFAWGSTFAEGKGHFVIGGEFLDKDGVIPRTARANAGRWNVMPIGGGKLALLPDVGSSVMSYGGLIRSGVLKNQSFSPDGTLEPFQLGGLVSGSLMSGGSGPSNDDTSPLVAPQKHYSILASGHYDINDDIGFIAQVRHSRMYNNYVWFADNTPSITIKRDNAFLPSSVGDAMDVAGENSFTLGRANRDINFPHIDFERLGTQATIGFDGFIKNGWSWTTYYSHAEANTRFETPGFLLADNWNNAVDSVLDPQTGAPICRVALTNPSTHCVPINLFGEGAPSRAAANYVTGTPSERSKVKMDVFSFTLNGEFMELPAGSVSFATGIDWRREAINQTVGLLDLANAFKSFSFHPMRGAFTVAEGFGEVNVPLVKDKPGFRDFNLNAAARYSHYDTAGGIWSWKVGFVDELVDGLRIRAAMSRDIRAANLDQLFTTSTTGWSDVYDPFTNQTVRALANSGGNPNLKPEKANTLTAGLSWAPPSVQGLTLSADYYNIDIKEVIVSLQMQDILDRCFHGSANLCDRIVRDASGNIERINTTYTNLAEYQTDGVDLEVGLRRPLSVLGADGTIRFRTIATWVHKLTTDDKVNTVNYLGSQGYAFLLGNPKWKAFSSVTYDTDAFSVDLVKRPRFSESLRSRGLE